MNHTNPRIVEHSDYRHDEHGRVTVVIATDDIVAFEICSETVRLSDGSVVPKADSEPLEAFAKRTEPAPVRVGAPATDPSVTVNSPQ